VSKNVLLNVVQNYIMLTHNIKFNQNMIIKSSTITCMHIYGHPWQSYKPVKFYLKSTKRSLLLISCTYIVLLFDCIFLYTILNTILYTIANMTSFLRLNDNHNVTYSDVS